VADVELEQKESLTRQEAATRLSALAKALADGGEVEIELGATTVKLHVPDQVRTEFEIEVDGDEIELELELKWSTTGGDKESKPT
jgi:amphi-Trp domain-containing protein